MWKVTYVNIISEAILKWIKRKQKISTYIPLFPFANVLLLIPSPFVL